MLILDNISKHFGGVRALHGVSTTFRAGSIHGVLGENGAGKTTLMRIAAGLSRPDAGHVEVRGRALTPGDPGDATRAGIAMVHQHFMLVPTLTVAENCMIGRRDLGAFPSRRAVAAQIREASARLDLQVDPDALVESLSIGERQRVEIVRALGRAGSCLILDEPTAVLTPAESEQLFVAMRRLRDDGVAVIFITHKLDEAKEVCDELTILRRGQRVYSGPAENLTTAQMAEHMVGSSLAPLRRPRPQQIDAPVVLEGRNVSASAGERRIADISFDLRAGEILGIAGVEGNGQSLLAAVLVGLVRADRGAITLAGHDVTRAGVAERARHGLAHIAEDRVAQALAPTMTLEENLALKAVPREALTGPGLIRWSAVRRRASERLRAFDVRPPEPAAIVRHLSGGNQQKVVLARELSGEPRVVLAHNPVRGLDIAATRFVFERLLEQRERGAGILLIHSDLDELLDVADRVAVMYDGRCTLTEWPECSRAEIGRRMLGGRI